MVVVLLVPCLKGTKNGNESLSEFNQRMQFNTNYKRETASLLFFALFLFHSLFLIHFFFLPHSLSFAALKSSPMMMLGSSGLQTGATFPRTFRSDPHPALHSLSLSVSLSLRIISLFQSLHFSSLTHFSLLIVPTKSIKWKEKEVTDEVKDRITNYIKKFSSHQIITHRR